MLNILFIHIPSAVTNSRQVAAAAKVLRDYGQLTQLKRVEAGDLSLVPSFDILVVDTTFDDGSAAVAAGIAYVHRIPVLELRREDLPPSVLSFAATFPYRNSAEIHDAVTRFLALGLPHRLRKQVLASVPHSS